jgi:integrase
MTIEKLPSGSYRIKQMYKGKRYTVTVDHKPTQKEATILMADAMQDIVTGKSASLLKCINSYIDSKHNVLSPSTIKGYVAVTRNSPQWLLDMNVYDMTQLDIQKAVNEYSKDHSPKSVRNFHALVISAVKMFRPNVVFHTTLPQKEAKETTVPEHDDIIRLLDAMREHEYYPCVVLGCLGLRRSEIQALEPSDFDDNGVNINKARVLNEYNQSVVKATKTTSSTRYVYVPSDIIRIIKDRGYVYQGNHNTLVNVMHRYQDKIGMPRCRFHDLRHFYVSYAHSIGMSDAAIMAAGGWKTDGVMKKVYRHSMNDREEQERVANSMFKL